MKTKILLIFVAIIFAVTKQIYSACVCNEKGTDVCSGCKGPLAVRPKQKHVGKPSIALPPIGDNCWCRKTLIEPVSLPKPFTAQQKSTLNCKGKGDKTYHNLPTIHAPPTVSTYPKPQLNYVPARPPKDDSPPADPISISLAMQAGKAIEVPEAKLAYGFVQKPIDGLPKVYHSSVQEENLYALKSDVITWKKPFAAYKQPDEDYTEADNEESISPTDMEEPPRLTYKQLGYVAEKFKNPEFQEVAQAYAPYTSNQPANVYSSKAAADYGSKPWPITNYPQNQKPYVGEFMKGY